MKKIFSLLLALLLVAGMAVPAYADVNQSRAVIGADLSDEQVEAVYGMFGIRRGDAIELKMTNAEERTYLEGYVDNSLIGTRSISCVYVELLPEGSGMSVTTSNINWCTGEMYISALATAGITDANIVVAAPFEVSGTAALSGVYKAYEDMTGKKLDDLAKLVSTQELTVTGELAAQIGAMDSTAIVNELKLMLDVTQTMSDDEIRAEIREIASRYNVNLTNTQVEQLLSLCRSLEGLDADSLKARVQEVQNTLQKVSDAKTKVVGFVQGVKKVVDSISGFFDKIKDAAKQMKEENKHMGTTMRRINDRISLYGNVNRGIKDGDFWQGSYVSIEGSNAVIYGSAQDDYIITRGRVTGFTLLGNGTNVTVGNDSMPSLRFLMKLADGKEAQVDIIYNKVDAFKNAIGVL